MWVQSSTSKNSSVLLGFPKVISAISFPSMGIKIPVELNKRYGCGFTCVPTRDAMCRLIKLVLAPVATMAQQGKSSASHFTHIPGLCLKFPVATTLGSSVLFASNTTGSFLCRILKDPGSALAVCVLKGVLCKAIDRGFTFRENATWAKIFVQLVPSGLIDVPRSRIPTVALF